MITRILMSGLRGKSIDSKLGEVTMVLGDNKTGKTTVADAIRWALLGYIPGIEKPIRNLRGWAELLGPIPAASVKLELDGDPSEIWRQIALEHGALKMNSSIVEPLNVNVLSLDPEKFFGETGPAQAQLIAQAATYQINWRALVPEQLRTENFDEFAAWPSWIGYALEEAKAKKLEADQERRMYTGTVQGLESLRQTVLDSSELETELKTLLENIGQKKAQLKQLATEITAVNKPKTVSPAMRQLQQVQRQLQEFIGLKRDPETIEARSKKAAKRLNKAASQPPQTQLDEWEAQRIAAMSEAGVATANMTNIRVKQENVKAKYAQLKKAHKCPTCGAKGENFKATIVTLEAEELTALDAALEAERKTFVSAKERLSAVEEQLKQARETAKTLEEIRTELDTIEKERRAIETWALHDQLVAQVESEQKAAVDVEELSGRYYTIEEHLEELGERADYLQGQITEVNHRRSQKRQLLEAEEALKKAEETSAHWTATAKALESLRDKFTRMSLEPILATLSVFTQGIIAEPVELDGHELGRFIDAKWTPLRQFSGAEQAVVRAAMTCALGGNSGKPNIVIVDEMGSFDEAHLHKFLKNVSAAIEKGYLAQFVGFSTPRLKKLPAAVKEVRL